MTPLKSILISTAALALIFTSASANAQAVTKTPKLKLRIAVNQGKWEALRWEAYNVDSDVKRALQAKIIEKLQRTGMFEVMEREMTSEMQRRSEEAVAAERDARNQQHGRPAMQLREVAVPADYIITPEIVGFNVTSKAGQGINLGGIAQRVGLGGLVRGGNISSGSVKTTAELSLRIFSSETSSILDIASGKGEQVQKNQKLDGSILGVGLTQDKFQESPAGKAIEDALDAAVAQMVSRLSQIPWKATIAAVSKATGRITINRGSSSGLCTGMEFTVYDVDEAGLDPETNLPIPGDETPVGKLKIVRVEPGYAYAEIVTGKGIKAKNVIRQN